MSAKYAETFFEIQLLYHIQVVGSINNKDAFFFCVYLLVALELYAGIFLGRLKTSFGVGSCDRHSSNIVGSDSILWSATSVYSLYCFSYLRFGALEGVIKTLNPRSRT